MAPGMLLSCIISAKVHIHKQKLNGNVNVRRYLCARMKRYLMCRRSSDVLYCSGHCTLPGGRKLYTGGAFYYNLSQITETEFGLPYARLFDSVRKKFQRIEEELPIGQSWYPTNVLLPSGQVLVTGGLYEFTPDGKVCLCFQAHVHAPYTHMCATALARARTHVHAQTSAHFSIADMITNLFSSVQQPRFVSV